MHIQPIHTATVVGVDGHPIRVEVDLLRRLPAVSIVGLPDGAIRESADRIRSAIQNSGFQFPRKRVVINLAPAGLKKSGTMFDLPIAMAILQMDGQLESKIDLSQCLVIGELALSGALRPIRGALSVALLAKSMGYQQMILPMDNWKEVSVITEVDCIGCNTLTDAISYLSGEDVTPAEISNVSVYPKSSLDMSEVRGHDTPKRVLEIAAAGGHNVLMIGAPGCGKSMLAKRMSTILPKLTLQEAIDVTRIHSCAGILIRDGLVMERPFRSPHHSISTAGMIGNSKLLPGEVSLAHNGILFLDEMAEYRRDVLESLRTPLEDGEVTITRASGQASFPAKCTLIAAVNPCPCGWRFHPDKICTCSQSQLQRYASKLSGPILDRIDLHIWVEPITTSQFFDQTDPEPSDVIRSRVQSCRSKQTQRYTNSEFRCNADLQGEGLWEHCQLASKCQSWLIDIANQELLSARSVSRVIKVARTIADLDEVEQISKQHIAEAIGYRVTSEVVQ